MNVIFQATDALPLREAATENHIEAWTVIVVQTVTVDLSVVTETVTIVTATMDDILLPLVIVPTVHTEAMVEEV